MHLYRDQNGEILGSAAKIDLRTEEKNLKYSREIEILEDAKLIAKLSPKHRAIITARNEGLSYKEIADKIGVPIGTVMSRLFWAKRNLGKVNNEKYKAPRAKSANYQDHIDSFNDPKFGDWKAEFEILALERAKNGFFLKDLPRPKVGNTAMKNVIKTMVIHGKLKANRVGTSHYYELP